VDVLARFGCEEVVLKEEIRHFLTEPTGYYAISASGRILQILKSQPIQPDIIDFEDFTTFLWVEALDGFYLLSQHFKDGRPGSWYIRRLLVPEERHRFFMLFQEAIMDYLLTIEPLE